MTEVERYHEYQICKKRGHSQISEAFANVGVGAPNMQGGTRWQKCRWCETEYRTCLVPKMEERNVPKLADAELDTVDSGQG